MAICIDTRIFRRVVQEHEERIHKAAIEAITNTMLETYRFGWASKDYIEECAKERLNASLDGKPWPVRGCH